ncbi:MAG: hypothetical protein V4640_11300 [Verrucomicrobiota bacterium]
MTALPYDPNATIDNPREVKAQSSLEKGKESVSSCCDSICSQSSQLCESTSNAIRRNPISSVIGAAFVGAAVAYLILENRHQLSFRDRYVSGPLSDANESVQDSLRSIYDTLKFW